MYLYLSNNFDYSTEYDDEDIEYEEDVIDSFAESKLGLDDIEDKEKMEKLGMDEWIRLDFYFSRPRMNSFPLPVSGLPPCPPQINFNSSG